MAKSAQIRARTDAETKREAEEVLERLGLTPSAAINMFYRQVIMRRALPFPAEVPNDETQRAIEAARAGDVLEGEDLQELLVRLLTKHERTVDVADLVGSDPGLLEAAERIARSAG